MDLVYFNKYLKYKTKYNLLKAGAKVPDKLPNTQSWFFMPFLLLPFNDVNIDFKTLTPVIEKLINDELSEITTIDTFKEYLRKKLMEKNNPEYPINFEDRRTLVNYKKDTLKLFYDDANFLHLDGKKQDALIDDLNMTSLITICVAFLFQDHKNEEFTFSPIKNYGIQTLTPKLSKDIYTNILAQNNQNGLWFFKMFFLIPFTDLNIKFFFNTEIDKIYQNALKIYNILYDPKINKPPIDYKTLIKTIQTKYTSDGINLSNRNTFTTIYGIQFENVNKLAIHLDSIPTLMSKFTNISLENILNIFNFIILISQLDSKIYVQKK